MLINFGSRAMTTLEFRLSAFGIWVSLGFFSPQPIKTKDAASVMLKQSLWEMDCMKPVFSRIRLWIQCCLIIILSLTPCSAGSDSVEKGSADRLGRGHRRPAE